MEISRRDWQLLSEYVDGELPKEKRTRLEERLDSEQALHEALQRLKRTRQTLRSTPAVNAPRNFTLTPQMVGEGARQTLFPVFRFATALASFLLIAVLIFDFAGIVLPQPYAGAPAPAAQEELLESAAEDRQEELKGPQAGDIEVEEMAPEMEVEEEADRTEGAKALGVEEDTMTPAPTATAPSPSPTIPPPTPAPEGLAREKGWPLVRVIEIILAGLVLTFVTGMFLSRQRGRDAG